MNKTTVLLCALLCAGCEPSSSNTSPATPNSSNQGMPSGSVTSPPPQGSGTGSPTGSPSAEADAPALTRVVAAGPADVASKASNAFAFDLLHQLQGSDNLAYSPASISLALSMTQAGAKGETASQMAKVLRLPSDPAAVHGSWQTILANWQKDEKPFELAVVNRLFGQKKFEFEAPFLKLTASNYAAPLELLDFAANPDKERRYINGWVAKQTRDRIKDLIPPPGVTLDTRMVLSNAIYFKAQWDMPFGNDSADHRSFYKTKDSIRQMEMMRKSQRTRYAAADGVRLVELPYKGGAFSMMVMLPDARDGLAKAEAALTADVLDGWIKALEYKQVAVTMPRFKIDPGESLALRDTLSAMGMPLAFQRGEADFTGMANPPNPADKLNISNVFHKAFVAVDEKGTEAAAATVVVMGRGGGAMPAKPIEFVVDHPFMFFIRDNSTNLVTFVGRVTDPV